MDLKKLKSGTDIRGAALPYENTEVDLTPEAVSKLVKAFAVLLKERNPAAKRVAVGRDSRLSGPALAGAAAAALADSGLEVLDCGLCSTPSMFMMTVYDEVRCDASVMVTASHHPYYRNGLKFFFPEGGAESGDIDKIIEYAEADRHVAPAQAGKTVKGDYMRLYCDFLRNKIVSALHGGEKPLAGMHIVVDAGNGAGGFYAQRVLEPLGADISGSQFLDPDGSFPNHIPNPEDAAAMRSVKECVLRNKADLGVIFDTDVDRAAIVASDGEEINRNRLIALISSVVLDKYPGATIVTDSVTSDGLREFIERRGGVHHRFKRGYRNVINEAVRLCGEGTEAPLAIETSGHAALKDNYFLDDGAYLVTELIIKAVQLKAEGKTLESLIADLRCPLEEKEIRLSFAPGADFKRVGAYIIESLKAVRLKNFEVAADNYEGVRVSIPAYKGWFLVRMSVHDPIMPVNIESDSEGGVRAIAAVLYAYLKEFPLLDTENLRKAAL